MILVSISLESNTKRHRVRGKKMKKPKGLSLLYIGITSLLVSTIALNVGITIALYNKSIKGNGTYGEVSLRSYYERGSGTLEDPFVITRPRHLYNLSRLQGLGVYEEKKYFTLGMVGLGGDTSGRPMCYVDETSELKPYLDMSHSNYSTNPINAIGSEALPFYGEFDGQNVEIKNLNVYASPEDAGLFGYTAHASVVKNLFLSDVTINAMGYTEGYAELYDPNSDLAESAYFIYNPNNGDSSVNFVQGTQTTMFTYYFDTESEETFEFDENNPNSSNIPSITIQSPDNNYDYYPILSGDLIKFTGSNNNTIVPNLERVFEFFNENKVAEGATQASSTVSLIVSNVDNYGIKHSKVLCSLDFNFTLDSPTSDHITLAVHLGDNHTNNIGLVIGHCDGTARDCYVYNGTFKMNNGDEVTLSNADTYHRLPNGSNFGLIGLVGGTVQNILARESDINAIEGKNIGVLDFTTVYKDVIDPSTSFVGSETYASGNNGGVTYQPILTSKYIDYLRKNVNATTNLKYVTLNNSSVSFRGQSIITNTDLGVFTVATDAGTTGYGSSAGTNLQNSVVKNDNNLAVDGKYFIYYSTGEYCNSIYSREGITFNQYRDSFNSNAPSQIVVGNHFPSKETTTKETFAARELRHNYYVRFALDPDYRISNGFYFSDLDDTSAGGSYMSRYFNYKLVDQNNIPIPTDSPKCGLMIKDTLRQEVRSLSASFALQDLSNSTAIARYIEDGENNKYVSNMVNFEIKTNYANVTVIAAPTEYGKAAALGVYKLDDADFSNNKFNQKYNQPDYAFFMPDDNHLSYFDYRVDKNKQNGRRGEIGVYTDAQGQNFVVANETTNATVANDVSRVGNEYGHANNVPRLFAHTFYLPKGRYCFGSATGKESGASPVQTTARIFYVCAQGQDNGQLDFDDNVFSGNDTVEKVDFLKRPRFDIENPNKDIIIENVTTYNPNDRRLANQRCYVALVNSDRSLFDDSANSNISFTYNQNTGVFEITSTTMSAMTHVAVNNYPHTLAGDDKYLVVSLFGQTSSGTVLVYPSGG